MIYFFRTLPEVCNLYILLTKQKIYLKLLRVIKGKLRNLEQSWLPYSRWSEWQNRSHFLTLKKEQNYGEFWKKQKRQPGTHYPQYDHYLTVSILNKLKSKMEQSSIDLCYQPLFFHYIFYPKATFRSGIFKEVRDQNSRGHKSLFSSNFLLRLRK
jgi:hypothetical protein